MAALTAASKVLSSPNFSNNGVHSGLSISAVRRAFNVFRKSAFLRRDSPDAFPPLRPYSRASLGLKRLKLPLFAITSPSYLTVFLESKKAANATSHSCLFLV
nr:MAG TPA: hypothetical protein [Caudoviricetes sp.]